jgi:two-component system response regulator
VTPELLLVEADAAEAELITSMVRCRVAVARDGAEALQALAAHPLRLVLLADRLPGLDGLELLDRLRADPRLPPLPVVVLTSDPTPALVRRAYERGANSVVRKPVLFEELGTALREVEDYWLARNEPATAPA